MVHVSKKNRSHFPSSLLIFGPHILWKSSVPSGPLVYNACSLALKMHCSSKNFNYFKIDLRKKNVLVLQRLLHWTANELNNYETGIKKSDHGHKTVFFQSLLTMNSRSALPLLLLAW